MQPQNQNNNIPPPPKQVVDVIANPPKATTAQAVPTQDLVQEGVKANQKAAETTSKVPEDKTESPKKPKQTPVLAIFFAIILAIALISLAVYTQLESQT